MVTIAVSGEGKTVTALRIVALLRAEGFEVEYRSKTAERTAAMEELLKKIPDLARFAKEPGRFLVRDET